MHDDKLKLVFKGERNYVQGPTIFDETIRLLAGAGYNPLHDVEFLIHKMTSANLRLVIETHRDSTPAVDDVAVMRFMANGQPVQAYVRPDSGDPDARVPYDESEVTNRCALDTSARSVRLAQDGFGFSPIEVLVSMTKALHLAVLEKPANTSWVFCRWDSPCWPLPADLSGVTITLKQVLGTRLTRADVERGDLCIGHIYFSARALS